MNQALPILLGAIALAASLTAGTVVQSHDFAASNADSLYHGSGTTVLVNSVFFSANMQPFDASLGTLQSFTVKWENISGMLSGTVGPTGGSASGSFGGPLMIAGNPYTSGGGGNGGGADPNQPIVVSFPASPFVSEAAFPVVGCTYNPAILATVTGTSPFAVAFTGPVTVYYTNVVDLAASVTGKVTLTYTYEPAPQPTYADWALTNAPDPQTAGDDYDHDGVSNGVEYFMGVAKGDLSVTTLPTVDASNKVTWPNGGNIPDTAYGTRFVVQTSTNLMHWDDVLAGDPQLSNLAGSVCYTLPKDAGKVFVRLSVTP